MLLTLGLAMWIKGLLGVGFLMVCLILILTVLIQRPPGGGLTRIMFVVFVLGGIGMKFVTTPTGPPPPAAIGAPGGPAPSEAPADDQTQPGAAEPGEPQPAETGETTDPGAGEQTPGEAGGASGEQPTDPAGPGAGDPPPPTGGG